MAKPHRQLDLSNKEDINMLCTELAVVDQTGILIQCLKSTLIREEMTRVLVEGKQPLGKGDPLPIPADFIKFIREWRENMRQVVERADNLIQIMEEGV